MPSCSIQNQQIFLNRISDDWSLGSVMMYGAAPYTAYRHHLTSAVGARSFPTLDAAVHWVETNPHAPDLTAYPHQDDVYGPVLATWNGHRLVGCVWATTDTIAPGLGTRADVCEASFLVLGPQGRICAKLVETERGSSLHWAASDTTDILIRKLTHVLDALELLCQTAIERIGAASGHERLRMRQGVPDVVARMDAFRAQRAAWRQAFLSPAEDLAEPATTSMSHVPVVRSQDDFPLGSIRRARNGYAVLRQDHDQQTRDAQLMPSLDAARDWLIASPHAPDLQRFPFTNRIYGPVLWSTSKIRVIGMVGQKASVAYGLDMRTQLVILGVRQKVLGYLCRDQATWRFYVFQNNTRTEVMNSPNLDAVLAEMHQRLVAVHDTAKQSGLRSKAPKVLATMKGFLAEHAAQAAAFLQGTPEPLQGTPDPVT